MKQLKNKILRKKDAEAPGRITNDTVAEHREQILAGGRKFKYPVQYSKHKILINTVIIVVAALTLFVGWSWWSLYVRQSTSDFFFSVTRVVPVPVAKVDGAPVRFSDYLRRVRASIFYLEKQEGRNFNTEDGRRELEYVKRRDLDEAIRAALASRLAKENNITVSDQEIDENILSTLRIQGENSISEKAYESGSLRRYFGWSLNDYRIIVHDRLLLQKVSFAIDEPAKTKISQAKKSLDDGADFAEVAAKMSDDPSRDNGGIVGEIAIGDLDANGLIAAARGLEPGQVSDIIKGVDGYYIIKLNAKNTATVDYLMIKVELREFDNLFNQLRQDGKIREFIRVKED